MLGDKFLLAEDNPVYSKGVDVTEVKSVCRPVMLFHIKLGKSLFMELALYTEALSC